MKVLVKGSHYCILCYVRLGEPGLKHSSEAKCAPCALVCKVSMTVEGKDCCQGSVRIKTICLMCKCLLFAVIIMKYFTCGARSSFYGRSFFTCQLQVGI